MKSLSSAAAGPVQSRARRIPSSADASAGASAAAYRWRRLTWKSFCGRRGAGAAGGVGVAAAEFAQRRRRFDVSCTRACWRFRPTSRLRRSGLFFFIQGKSCEHSV